jgi:flagellar L-ring protein precursor FlgH
MSMKFSTIPQLCAFCLLGLACLAPADSLYHEDTFRPLISDRRAAAPGDVITVQVIENASASANADSTLGKSGSLGIGITTDVRSPSAKLTLNDDYSGKGATDRAGKVTATLSVSVVAVDPNGDLEISGEQLITVNGERQQIRLDGRVRAQDISATNTVLSSRVADVRLVFIGDGKIAQHQEPGALARVLGWLGLL